MIPDYIQQNSLATGPLLQEIHSEVCDQLFSTRISQSEGSRVQNLARWPTILAEVNAGFFTNTSQMAG